MEVGGRRSWRPGSGSRPASTPSRSSSSAAEGADADLVLLLAQLAVRGDGLAQALDHDLVADCRRRRAAGWSRPSRRPRARRGAAASALVGAPAGCSTIASATRPPGSQVARRRSSGTRPARRRRRAAATSCIGASARASRVGSQLEAAGVADAAARSGRPSARSRQRRDQLRVEIEADRLGPRRARCRATRPVPQPRSRTGPSACARQLLPERQVGAVGAVLDVVPDPPLAAALTARTPWRQAAVGEQLAQLEQRRVGGEGEEPARARRRRRCVERVLDPRHDLDRVRSASPRTSAAAPSPAPGCRRR